MTLLKKQNREIMAEQVRKGLKFNGHNSVAINDLYVEKNVYFCQYVVDVF